MQNLHDFVGPWMYWPAVVVMITGTITWTLNCVSVTYSEVYKQIQELCRVKNGKTDNLDS